VEGRLSLLRPTKLGSDALRGLAYTGTEYVPGGRLDPAAYAVGEPARGLMTETKNHAAFIWSVADLLRGDYKQSE
jgi:hypothetical protein